MTATLFLVDSSAVNQEMLDLSTPGEKQCQLCGDAVGIVEDDDPTTEAILKWEPYYELMVSGDSGPTVLCQRDIEWLTEAAPALLG